MPALPTFSVSRISPERVEDVLADVRATGVLDRSPTRPSRTAASRSSPPSSTARRAPSGCRTAPARPCLERALRGLPAFGERRYEPQALAVFAARVKDVVVPDHEFEPEPTTFPWPTGVLVPGCAIVRGPELERVLADARRANQLTRWQSGGALHAAAFRPLLPGESSCADVTP